MTVLCHFIWGEVLGLEVWKVHFFDKRQSTPKKKTPFLRKKSLWDVMLQFHSNH